MNTFARTRVAVHPSRTLPAGRVPVARRAAVRLPWSVTLSCPRRTRGCASTRCWAPPSRTHTWPHRPGTSGPIAAYAAFCRADACGSTTFWWAGSSSVGSAWRCAIVDEDPYPDVESMVDDVRQRRLKVWASAATGNPHPYLSDGENDMFRAVHDVFGHAASGRGFDPHGEEAAWLKHSTMYSPLARRALTTETRGQNCAQTFHYGGTRFPGAEGGAVAAAVQ